METATAASPEPSAGSAGPVLTGLADAAHQRVTGILELAGAEARLAATSLWLMALSVLLAAACVLGAWGLALAAFVSGLALLGASLWAVLLLLAALHAAAAALLWRAGLTLSHRLTFPATRHELRDTTGHQ